MGKNETRWFRATAAKQPPAAINESVGLMQGVSICSVGAANGHGVWLDTEFVADVSRLGNEIAMGVKARFGHPNMSNEALGTYLGRFTNFRVSADEQQVLADLQLDESAYNTPNGNLADYVLTLARTSPDQFGASIVFRVGTQYYRRADNGEKISQQEYWRDEVKLDELEIDPNYPTDPKTYVSIKTLYGTDLVDEPAANETGLFSTQFTTHLFASRATEFLNENPDIAEWLVSNQEKLSAFVAKYAANRNQPNTIMDPQLQEELQAKIDAADTALAAEKTLATELQSKVTELQAKQIELETKIAELSKTPAVNMQAPKGADHQDTDETDFSNQPWNRAAQSMFKKTK